MGPGLRRHSLQRARYPELEAIVLEDDPAAALASEDLVTRQTAWRFPRHGRQVMFFARVPLTRQTAWRYPRHGGHVFLSRSRPTPVRVLPGVLSSTIRKQCGCDNAESHAAGQVVALGDAPCQPRTSKKCTFGWNHWGNHTHRNARRRTCRPGLCELNPAMS